MVPEPPGTVGAGPGSTEVVDEEPGPAPEPPVVVLAPDRPVDGVEVVEVVEEVDVEVGAP